MTVLSQAVKTILLTADLKMNLTRFSVQTDTTGSMECPPACIFVSGYRMSVPISDLDLNLDLDLD